MIVTVKRTGARHLGRTVCLRGFVAACALAGLCIAGCSSHSEAEDQSSVVTVQVAKAETEKIQEKVTADAVVYPKDQAAIVAKVTAPVRKFYVERGARVHAGQLLAELENQDLAGSVKENEGAYAEAQANLDAATQKSEQDLKLAREQLDAQQKIFDNRQMLLQQGAVAAKDVQDARIALTQAQDQYQRAEKQYELKAAQGQAAAAQGRSASAQAQLGYTKIVSPINGVVTDRPLFAGETPASGAPIVTVMDLSQITARAHISQQDAQSLKVGAPATISAPGMDDLPGKVTLVSPALDPGSSTVEVWVQAANPGDRLKAGASVKVSMVTRTVAQAIVIPASALLTGDGGATSVFVFDGSKPRRQAVQAGIRNADDVQITSGVKPGDQVITSGAFELDREDPDVLAKTKVQVETAQPGADDDDKGKSDKGAGGGDKTDSKDKDKD